MMSALLASLLMAGSVRLVPFERRVTALAFGPRGTLFAGTDFRLVAWDPRSGRTIELAKTSGTISFVAARAEDDVAFSLPFDGLARWTKKSGVGVLRPRTKGRTAILRALSPSGRTIAVRETDGAVRLLRASGNGWRETRVHAADWAATIELDDERCAFGGRKDGLGDEVFVHELASGRTRRVGKAQEVVRALRWTDGGKSLLCVGDLLAEKLDARTGRSLGKRRIASQGDLAITACPSPLGGVWVLSQHRLRYVDEAMRVRASVLLGWRLRIPDAMACGSDGKTVAVADGTSVRVFKFSTASVRR